MSGNFANPLWELNDYEEFYKALTKGSTAVGMTGCVDSEKVHFMSTFLGERTYQLVVTYNEQRAREIYEDYRYFSQDVYLFPAKDMIFFQADVQNNTITAERMRAIEALLNKKEAVIITTVDALMNKMLPIERIKKAGIQLSQGDCISLEELAKNLFAAGYERVSRTEQPGQFCIHGGIADIYPLTAQTPIRIEMFDDEIDSIRCFDVMSQRSIEVIETVWIYPASEFVMTETERLVGMRAVADELKKQVAIYRKGKKEEKAKNLRGIIEPFLELLEANQMTLSIEGYLAYFYEETVTFLDYFPQKDTLIFLDEPTHLAERGDGIFLEFEESMKNRLEQGYILPKQACLMNSVKTVFANLQRSGTALLSSLDNRFSVIHTEHVYALYVQSVNTYKENFEYLIEDLKRWKREKYRIVLLCSSHTRGKRLETDLRGYDLLVYYSEEEEKEIVPGEIMITYGNLKRGFVYPMIKFAVITDNDLFGIEKKRKKKKQEYSGKKIQAFSDLKPGDYVIHENNGLGIYRGSEKVEVDRTLKDYLKIEYGDGGSLYIPVTQLNTIQKYADASAAVPKLNNLGTAEWSKTKSRVKKAVADIAKELVQLYAARQNEKGYAFEKDTAWQREFEEDFPFEETQDQLMAIEAAKADMESTKIMDRLICGDVGYGKTEIALRAAFKAVQDSKQVAYLVPTTILAQQHYNTFVQRMKNYPIKIALLSRFRTSAQIKKTLQDLKKGLVDVVIGTHRLLSKDVVFKDLGLLIIDEEQRFGVTHKEKIKQMKKNVDVMTLTATPIPRTLHMSMIGIRDMSVLEEAPSARRPIQTYVMELNMEMVREAINRELARDGQVYYVYNRVKDIDLVASEIAKLVPDAVVAYAHGQMNEREMEKIMMDFVNGEIDVLVSTTIIETGLDIPNVNTIIIHDADRYGLSQLYQLRGRVGRSNRTAYAFILYQTGKQLKEIAEKRLQAIREYTELGSGIRIAMRDLELRGAGNLLGSEQHGHMEAVGYDLYCKMLHEAIQTEKGEIKEEEIFDTAIDIPINAYIPDTYIRNDSVKIDIYKRIAAIENEDEAGELIDELIDRFGEPSKSVMNLIGVALLRIKAHEVFIKEIKADRVSAKIYIQAAEGLKLEKLPELMKLYNGSLKIVNGEKSYLMLSAGKGKVKEKILDLHVLRQFVEDMKNCLKE